MVGLLTLSLVVSSCRSSDDAETTDEAAPDAITDTSPLDADGRDTMTADVRSETSRTDASDTALRDLPQREEQMVRVSYQTVEPACAVGNCTEGVAVQFVSKDLIKIGLANERPTRLDNSDYRELRRLLLEPIVVRKMKRGWQCGDEETHNQVEHQFRARFRFSDVQRPQIHTISGCIPRDSPYRDRTRVRNIVDTLQQMKRKYFDGD
jgi:hypothetical protein